MTPPHSARSAPCDAIYRLPWRAQVPASAEDLTTRCSPASSSRCRSTMPAGGFRSWLYGIARPSAPISGGDTRYPRATLILAGDTGAVGARAAAGNGRLSAWALSLLSALPHQYRRVLELRILEGRSVADTRIMGITANYIGVHTAPSCATAVTREDAQKSDDQRGD